MFFRTKVIDQDVFLNLFEGGGFIDSNKGNLDFGCVLWRFRLVGSDL